jgi:penicillin-binding protein 1A
MVSAYSAFPNKGVRVEPHLIRKVYSRDGSLLEESKGTTSRVTSEYVAGTMVEMMRAVTSGAGTAPGANASGHPLAGKTGTVNDQTDVWFIGYTPTYVTGVWMGNPLKKESLGAGMTGGRGALPYFNAFMIPFMKDKEKERFYETPSIPSDIKSLIEQRKREEQEKLEKADEAGRTLGVSFNTGTRTRSKTPNSLITGGEPTTLTAPTDTTETSKPVETVKPPVSDEPPKPVTTITPARRPEPPTEKPNVEGAKRKGKKGDGEN